MASAVEEAWYCAGFGVPVGWNDGAVAFKFVPLVPCMDDAVIVVVAIGAMVRVVRERRE